MKTVFIYDQCGECNIKFFIAEGDHSDLDGVFINDSDCTDEQCDKLNMLLGYGENGEGNLIKLLDKFPTQEVRDGAIVVVVGFIP